MGRLFFMHSHACVGASGGGHGVEYRLFLADKKYNYFPDETFYVFGDRVVKKGDDLGSFLESKDMPKPSELRVKIRKFIPNFLRTIKFEKNLDKLSDYIKMINKTYEFTDDDVFIFHDIKTANAFYRAFHFKKTVMVYHAQGSLYNEWSAYTGLSSKVMKNYFFSLFRDTVSKLKVLAFPSKGAEESLVLSEPELEDVISTVDREYLYNGIDCPDVTITKKDKWISDLQKSEGYLFATVAVLNTAKSVERIPIYLGTLKKHGVNFKWILVGNGVQAEAVERSIRDNNLEDCIIWKKEGLPHEDILKLFSVTDFYILLHKYSIFDLSTLEAMHYGNIPVLTPVGGNKEVIIRNNGVFVSEFDNTKELEEIMKTDICQIKRTNMEIQKENFDEKSFISRYLEIYKRLTTAK